MRLGLICVGRLKAGPEREIYARYAERVAALRRIGLEGLDLKEIDESKSKSPAERMAREGEEMLALVPADAGLVVFDERGKAADSAAFASFIGRERDAGRKALWFAIGGSEGLDGAVRARATAVYSFGAMTLPHQFVRILAAEQIYRAMTILSGHPYHRA
ncbi:23S rRNA (pseudouridine(1915)-N(3))-methyltransferase RlmH [Methylocystis echinoides]|uniref:Ribosomal RNA large subunit methyltransferase H n=1 Tax=Methylocystis echinoides TaxID=29468 RepID=A0A9W6GU40_9HYPH|nr:23S rRNA (pseudouridine(1915)-N(3))-methyltransferase RlmH [Methylocystis echinoides]GLI93117.1 ribosomal RNA large subunit methyltransferase H [Methylocystis echinoides]